MNVKTILYDRTFLSLIWLPLIGCIIGGITLIVFLSIIWLLSESTPLFFEELRSTIRPTIIYSVLFISLLLIIVFLPGLRRIGEYIFLPFIPATNWSEIRAMDKDDEYLFKDTIWLGIGVLVMIVFVIAYLDGAPWKTALIRSFLLGLPFAIAFWMLSFTKIFIEVCLLILRYFIQKAGKMA